MVRWGQLFDSIGPRDGRYYRDELSRLLPASNDDLPRSSIPAKDVTKIAMRLKFQIEQVIPIELEEEKVTSANSPIITKKVIETTKQAGGKDHRACVVYCLLVCLRWFNRQAILELWDADLHLVRAKACEMLAKHIIETEEDQTYLLKEVLLKRYSIYRNGEETEPANVIERAVDLHALNVIGSSGYQKCVKHLWKGWLCQDDKDASNFIEYKEKTNESYWAHLNPDRMRAPVYQNAVQIFITILYLVLYTQCVNTINKDGDLDVVEAILYGMTFGFICDEISKFWKIGRYYFSFWNAFNCTLYSLLAVSFVLRMIALGHRGNEDQVIKFNQLGYNFFCFSAPMFWMRLLLYLDTFRFFGAMLVVLKVMMKESLIFFALLIIVVIGFLQAFIGMDDIDDNADATTFILQAMANSVMQSPDFSGFDNFSPPFGIILYYIFTFVVMVVLLNILIALYNSAYEDITDNATDEYMALFASKTMQFVRAPDENVFIAPFNLIELFLLIIPFEWWMDSYRYERLNNFVMGVVYSPLLLVVAAVEARDARVARSNRRRGEEDDDTVEEWEQMGDMVDFERDGWAKKVEVSKPNVEVEAAVLEIRKLKEMVSELQIAVERMSPGPE